MRVTLWLVLAILVFIVALIVKQVALLVVAVLLLLSAGSSRLWHRYCLRRVEFKRALSRNRVFYGEEIVYETEVVNRKILPLPWLQTEDELPEEVTLLKGETDKAYQNRVTLSNLFPISLYHKIKRRYPMRCLQRGVYTFGPTRIRSGDLFGLLQREMVVSDIEFLTVYPRLVPLESLRIPSRQLFGDIRIKNHLFQDPILTAGVRDYHYGDSLKRIHWKSSARLARLQTKVYEPTTTIDLSIFLDVRTVEEPLWGSRTQLQELGIIAAASIAKHALESGFRVGLYANQSSLTTGGTVRVPHSRHANQLVEILTALARLHHSESLPISRFIRQETPGLPWGSTLLVIAAQPNDELLSTLLDLKRPGRNTALVKLGGDPIELYDSRLSVYYIPDDVAWEVLDGISIQDSNSGLSKANAGSGENDRNT